MKKILLKDIAETLGLSISQVSRALNHQGYVSGDTRNQVMRMAKKMKYRNLSNRHKKKIAVLTGNFGEFASNILNQIQIESERMKFSFYVRFCQVTIVFFCHFFLIFLRFFRWTEKYFVLAVL